MSKIVLAKLKELYGENIPYKNSIKLIKVNGGHVLKVDPTSNAVTFIFPDNSTLDLINK
jgi:hypothetical protein